MQNHQLPALIFLECNKSFGFTLLRRATASLRARIVVCAKDPSALEHVSPLDVDILQCDTADVASVLRTVQDIAAGQQLVGIAAGYEGSVAVAATVAQIIGLPAPSPIAAWDTRYKPRARAFSNQYAGNPVDSYLITNISDISRIPQTAYPVIAKPVASGGSYGVEPCDHEEGLRDYVNHWHTISGGPTIAEVTIPGVDYSVEIFDGEPIALNKKLKGGRFNFVDVGHSVARLDAFPEWPQMASYVNRLVDVLGLGWGPIHLELKFDGETPRLIEVNYRLGAGMIPDIIDLATGVDLYEATLAAYTGGTADLSRRPRRSGFATIRFMTAPACGRLVVSGHSEAASLPNIHSVALTTQPGSMVRPAQDSGDRLGYVIATGDSLEKSTAAADFALSRIAVSVE